MSNPSLSNIHLQRVWWAICSPPLLNSHLVFNYFRDNEHRQSVIELLLKLDSKNSIVDKHFAQHGHMAMGKYFEQLVFFIIDHDPHYEVLTTNHQIIENQRTLGELDILVKDLKTQRIEHWEICLKYYLQSKRSENQMDLIGPNAIDNMARKVHKLMNQQLPLSSHASIKHLIGTDVIENKLFMKGQLFYHFKTESRRFDGMNPQHEYGWWCHFSELNDMLNASFEWKLLSKPDWIGPHQTSNLHELMTATEMSKVAQAHFSKDKKALLMAGLTATDGSWIEQTRGFVVHDYWPQTFHHIP